MKKLKQILPTLGVVCLFIIPIAFITLLFYRFTQIVDTVMKSLVDF